MRVYRFCCSSVLLNNSSVKSMPCTRIPSNDHNQTHSARTAMAGGTTSNGRATAWGMGADGVVVNGPCLALVPREFSNHPPAGEFSSPATAAGSKFGATAVVPANNSVADMSQSPASKLEADILQQSQVEAESVEAEKDVRRKEKAPQSKEKDEQRKPRDGEEYAKQTTRATEATHCLPNIIKEVFVPKRDVTSLKRSRITPKDSSDYCADEHEDFHVFSPGGVTSAGVCYKVAELDSDSQHVPAVKRYKLNVADLDQRRNKHPPPCPSSAEEVLTISLPATVVQKEYDSLYKGKVVLSLQGRAGQAEVCRWICEYNRSTGSNLEYIATLFNQFHVVKVNGEKSMDKFLLSSPLQAGGVFAAVNRYHPAFDPVNPVKLNQIVTVVVHNTNHFVFNLLERILAEVGHKVVAKIISSDARHISTIQAVIHTNDEHFIPKIRVATGKDEYVTVVLEYNGTIRGLPLCHQKESSCSPSPSQAEGKDVGAQERGASGPTPSSSSQSSGKEKQQEEKVDLEEVPNSDFYDFDSVRTQSDIAAGQIWALYDDQDGMPRFYGRISRVSHVPFKVHMHWLEMPRSEKILQWEKSANLSSACGEFRIGKFTTIEYINMFSHIVMRRASKRLQKIYPRKHDVWAIFTNCDLSQRSGPQRIIRATGHGFTYSYEMVEILNDFSAKTGVKTVKLVRYGKYGNFKSLFQRLEGLEAVRVFPPSQLIAFSHRVPAEKVAADTALVHGIPKVGILELDPAATPLDIVLHHSS